MLRLFFALQPPLELGALLMERASPLLAELQTQAVPVSNLHATLCFMGAVPPERLDELRAAASRVRMAPFEIVFDVFEFWEKPKVLVAGAANGSIHGTALSNALQNASVDAGFSPDPKPFRAHLTLARKIRPTDAEKISWPREISPGFVVRCEKFLLMESRRSEHGSLYSVIESWPLYVPEHPPLIQ
jgi:RNA 2',3'-cyclic 3'-phosphodiesterase